MSEITYIRGDATVPSVKGVKVIAHVCNDIGGWRKGFVLGVSRRWPEPEAAYRAWHRDRASDDSAWTGQDVSSCREGCALKGRGELRDQPHTTRTRPAVRGAYGERYRLTRRSGTRGVAVTVYDHGESAS
jgi:hypothetical protein